MIIKLQGVLPGHMLVGRIAAPPDVAQRLDLDEGSSVLVRRRVFHLDGVPVALTDSYYPLSFAAGSPLEQPGPIKGGGHAVIEDPAGPIRRNIAYSADDITARMPTVAETEALNLGQGVPVFQILRTVYDAEDRPVEVQDTVAAASGTGSGTRSI